MKSFNEQVYDLVARIPAGAVASYGQIAQMLGRPNMSRFVGFASHHKKSWHLPWHRVVFKDGRLCPAASGWADAQYKNLKAEGVRFVKNKDGDRIVDMAKSQWNPDESAPFANLDDAPIKF
jgi:methylated-DNA-protein-cysteine methyltransferase-like protein